MLTLRNSEAATVSPEDVEKVVVSTRPSNVRVDEIQAGPVKMRNSHEGQHVRLSRGKPAYAVADDGRKLLIRLEHVLDCADTLESLDAEDEVTTIKMAHIVEFDVIGEVAVEAAVIAAFIETNAYFVAYPYVRQMFTTLTSEMGLVPVVLDYMHRSEWPFSNAE